MLYIGLQIRRQGADVRVLREDRRQGADHTGQRTGTRIQDQDEQQPEQEQTRQMTGTEGYRTGYNAVHRDKVRL